MRFPRQKRDISLITFYIVLSFVLFCIFVLIPILMLIYSYNLGSGDKNLSFDNILVLSIYLGAALLVAIVFLVFIFFFTRNKSIERLKEKITRDVQDSFNNQIESKIAEEPAKLAIQNGIDTLLDNRLTNSANKKIDNYFNQKRSEIEISIQGSQAQLVNDLANKSNVFFNEGKAEAEISLTGIKDQLANDLNASFNVKKNEVDTSLNQIKGQIEQDLNKKTRDLFDNKKTDLEDKILDLEKRIKQELDDKGKKINKELDELEQIAKDFKNKIKNGSSSPCEKFVHRLNSFFKKRQP